MTPKPDIVPAEHYQEDIDEEGRVVDSVDVHALTQLNAAEISQQIMTARAYPRNITTFRRSMRELVTYDQPTALSCLYALKRGSKVIEGPSIRFAEGALQAWGNARAGSRIVDVGEEFITSQGFFYDLERNMALAFEVMRRITDSNGQRYGDDMIGVTGNAASSIAFRNAILKGIPKMAWNESYQAARAVSIGKGESISVKREDMMKAFAPFGIVKEQIFAVLGVKGLDDVSIDHMILMGGILNSIKEGDITPEKAFAPENFAPNSAEVVPPRPQRSEFTREPGNGSAKKVEPKPKVAAKTKKKPEVKKPAPAENVAAPPVTKPPAGDPPPKDEEAERKAARAAEFEDWYSDQVAQIAKCTKVTGPEGLTALFDATVAQLEGDEAKRKDFDRRCAARQREILEASRKPK